MSKMRKLISHPGRYGLLALKMLEQRLSYLFSRTAFFLQGQMDIDRRSLWHDREFVRQSGGFFVPGDSVKREILDLEPWDLVRRDMLVLLLRSLIARRVEGELAELGVYEGRTARLIHHYMPDRRLHLFDTFCGFDKRDIAQEKVLTGASAAVGDFGDAKIEAVLRYIAKVNDNLKVYPGYFPASVPAELAHARFAFVHLDADLYEPTLTGLRYFYDKVAVGGFLIIHDYNAWLGARKATDEFFKDKKEAPLPMPDKSGSAVIVKQ